MKSAQMRNVRKHKAPPARTEATDRYLETIYYINGEGEIARPSRIAEWLGVSAPTVSIALQRLARDGWIEIARDRSVELTHEGEIAASEIVRRHRLVERWLTDVLGFDWVTADTEAERLSAAVSDEVLARIDSSMNHPTTCPHGNVIPGRAAPYGRLVPLADVPPGTTAVVRRISEVTEHDAPELLRQLASFGVKTGTEIRVLAEGSTGALAVSTGNRTMALNETTARWIWVQPRARTRR
ncbi:MAG: metal-dependent transcriptional regulator [Actinomycetota bacterium]